jgi:hypothetical protein
MASEVGGWWQARVDEIAHKAERVTH